MGTLCVNQRRSANFLFSTSDFVTPTLSKKQSVLTLKLDTLHHPGIHVKVARTSAIILKPLLLHVVRYDLIRQDLPFPPDSKLQRVADQKSYQTNPLDLINATDFPQKSPQSLDCLSAVGAFWHDFFIP